MILLRHTFFHTEETMLKKNEIGKMLLLSICGAVLGTFLANAFGFLWPLGAFLGGLCAVIAYRPHTFVAAVKAVVSRRGLEIAAIVGVTILMAAMAVASLMLVAAMVESINPSKGLAELLSAVFSVYLMCHAMWHLLFSSQAEVMTKEKRDFKGSIKLLLYMTWVMSPPKMLIVTPLRILYEAVINIPVAAKWMLKATRYILTTIYTDRALAIGVSATVGACIGYVAGYLMASVAAGMLCGICIYFMMNAHARET